MKLQEGGETGHGQCLCFPTEKHKICGRCLWSVTRIPVRFRFSSKFQTAFFLDKIVKSKSENLELRRPLPPGSSHQGDQQEAVRQQRWAAFRLGQCGEEKGEATDRQFLLPTDLTQPKLLMASSSVSFMCFNSCPLKMRSQPDV